MGYSLSEEPETHLLEGDFIPCFPELLGSPWPADRVDHSLLDKNKEIGIHLIGQSPYFAWKRVLL
jgi:hypothetical protein